MSYLCDNLIEVRNLIIFNIKRRFSFNFKQQSIQLSKETLKSLLKNPKMVQKLILCFVFLCFASSSNESLEGSCINFSTRFPLYYSGRSGDPFSYKCSVYASYNCVGTVMEIRNTDNFRFAAASFICSC